MLENNTYILEKLLGNIPLLRKNAGKTFTESCNNPVVIFVQVNLFILIMSVQVDLSVKVRFVKVNQLIIINLFVQTIFFSLIHQYQLNRYHLYFYFPF